jgi:hypothetical protein
MSWRSQIPLMVRHLINDLEPSNYKYSDDRIETSILVSAQMLTIETDFPNSYSIDIANGQLSPDPTSVDTKDNAFMNLTALKTACIIVGSELKTEASNAISIKDGPSAIDLRGVASTLSVLYKDLSDKYAKLLLDYRAGGSIVGHAILGPYSPASDYVVRTHGDYDSRGGYFRY